MKKTKADKTQVIERELNQLLEYWDKRKLLELIADVTLFYELFDEKDGNWIGDVVGPENEENVRVLRFIFLMSRFSEKYADKFATTNRRWRGLWYRMELEAEKMVDKADNGVLTIEDDDA